MSSSGAHDGHDRKTVGFAFSETVDHQTQIVKARTGRRNSLHVGYDLLPVVLPAGCPGACQGPS
jgi:hypothetical protein